MKAVHIQINIDNGEKFKCDVSIDLLEREDCNEFEQMMAKDLEEIVTKYVQTLADLMESKLTEKRIDK